MKKEILFVCFFIFVSNLFCDNFPLWYENKSLQFPDFEYISAVGTGYSETSAKDSAIPRGTKMAHRPRKGIYK